MSYDIAYEGGDTFVLEAALRAVHRRSNASDDPWVVTVRHRVQNGSEPEHVGIITTVNNTTPQPTILGLQLIDDDGDPLPRPALAISLHDIIHVTIE